MKTITKKYEYGELSKDAQRRALADWNKDNDMPFLQSMLNDECGQLLKAEGITCTSNHPICLYSLSNCQGDGLMFYGTFLWRDYLVKIKHSSNHYYHSYSKVTEIYKEVDGQEVEASADDVDEFEKLYQRICAQLEKYGYRLIEDETSEAHFIDECNANEWTFTKEGKMLNE